MFDVSFRSAKLKFAIALSASFVIVLGCTSAGQPNNGYSVAFKSATQSDAGLEFCFCVTGPPNGTATVGANTVQGPSGAQHQDIDLDVNGQGVACFTLPLAEPGDTIYFAASAETANPRLSATLGQLAWNCQMVATVAR